VYRYDLKSNQREAIYSEPGLWQIDDVADDGRIAHAFTSASATATPGAAGKDFD
jgi:hypothetical protein